MELKDTLMLLAQEFNQTEYGLGWGLTLGLILLGMLTICIPRPRKKVPKSMQAAEEAKARAQNRKKGKSPKKKKKTKKKS